MPIPRNFDYIAHNARVASQRSQMRADENIARTDQRSGPPARHSPVTLRPAVPAAPIPSLIGRVRAKAEKAPGNARGHVRVVLPYPPTTNHDKFGDHSLAPATRAFREHVAILHYQMRRPVVYGRLAVTISLYPSDWRGDIDNRVKPTLDALQRAGFFPNDSAIDSLVVTRYATRGTEASCVVDIATMPREEAA